MKILVLAFILISAVASAKESKKSRKPSQAQDVVQYRLTQPITLKRAQTFFDTAKKNGITDDDAITCTQNGHQWLRNFNIPFAYIHGGSVSWGESFAKQIKPAADGSGVVVCPDDHAVFPGGYCSIAFFGQTSLLAGRDEVTVSDIKFSDDPATYLNKKDRGDSRLYEELVIVDSYKTNVPRVTPNSLALNIRCKLDVEHTPEEWDALLKKGVIDTVLGSFVERVQ